MHITTNSCVTAQFVSIIIPVPQPLLCKLHNTASRQQTHSRRYGD